MKALAGSALPYSTHMFIYEPMWFHYQLNQHLYVVLTITTLDYQVIGVITVELWVARLFRPDYDDIKREVIDSNTFF